MILGKLQSFSGFANHLLRRSSTIGRLRAFSGVFEDSKATKNEQLVEHRRAFENPIDFWHEQAQKIHWFKQYDDVLQPSSKAMPCWYPGGEVNLCYSCVDEHVIAGRGDKAAFFYDSPVTNTKKTITYAELLKNVELFAGALVSLGVKTGDRVMIYMPGIPEVSVAMLGCARIGAIFTVVFGGFGRQEIAVRLEHSKPKLVVAASCGIDGKKVVDYKLMLEEAIILSSHKPSRCIIYQRPEKEANLVAGVDLTWNEAMERAVPYPVVPVPSNIPLYIAYTSGTTGAPKGIVRDQAGQIVSCRYSFDKIYDCQRDDVFFCGADIGWIVGQTCSVYGPLIAGSSSILYEGKPVKTPDAGALWRVVSEYGVKGLYTSPTAVRSIRRDDSNGVLMGNYDLSRLQNIFLAGERTDITTYQWLHDRLKGSKAGESSHRKFSIIDCWWQTETGWPITGSMRGYEDGKRFHPVPGSCGPPIPGWNVQILDDDGQIVAAESTGSVTIKLPLPPGSLTTLWENDEGCINAYLKRFPGYYDTGDFGYVSEEGYTHLLSRTDDIINIAAHRFSTSAYEEVIMRHPNVIDCLVVGISDSLKGQVPLGVVVLQKMIAEKAEVVGEVLQMVRKELGPVSDFKLCAVAEQLPKTRSGKTIRKLVAAIADGLPLKIPPTIEDSSVVDHLKQVLRESLNLPRESRT